MRKISLFTLSSLLAAGVSHGAAVHTGLLSYWDFEGNYDDSAGSISGNTSSVADNGTAGSAVALAGAGPLGTYGDFGRSALGTDNLVTVPVSADIDAAGESLSISAWFRVDSFDQNWQALVAHGEGSAWRIARRGDGNGLGYAGGTGDIPGADMAAVNDGLWHHVVAITEAGVSTRLWIDGNLIATSGGAPTLTNNSSTQMFIGGNPQGDSGAGDANQYRPWNGGIDDLALWDRALSEAEIGQIYNAGLAGTSLGAIPEPGAVSLVALSGLLMLRRRRR